MDTSKIGIMYGTVSVPMTQCGTLTVTTVNSTFLEMDTSKTEIVWYGIGTTDTVRYYCKQYFYCIISL